MNINQIKSDLADVERCLLGDSPRQWIDLGKVQRLASLASRLVDLPDDVREAMERAKKDWPLGYPPDHSYVLDMKTLANYFLTLTEPSDDNA